MINILRKHGSMIEARTSPIGSDPSYRRRYDPIGGYECQLRVFVGLRVRFSRFSYVFTHEDGPSTCAGIAKPNK